MKMTEQPLVSVIIPCYNAEKYVEMSVRSIMNQTYKNLEILIIDDCSNDSTYEILESLAKSDKRIILEKNEQNLRIVKTLNKLVLKAKGKYIARMDADDISASNRIEKQVEFMENNIEYGICGTSAWRIDENNRIIDKSYIPIENSDIQIISNYFCSFYHPSVMIKSNIYKENLYNENYLYAEDMELWQRILKISLAKNLKDKLLYYRVLSSSISNNSNSSNIQKKLSENLTHSQDISTLKLIKNKKLAGRYLLLLFIKNGKKLPIKFWIIQRIIIYLLVRFFEKESFIFHEKYAQIP